MSFYGSSFVFDGVASELYDLRIFEFEPSNPASSPVAGDASINEQWLYRREKPYFYGRYYETPLEFDFTIGSFSYIDGATRHAIESWLLGRATYLPLRIVQDDIYDIVFNAIITLSTHLYVGNLNYALTLHARCDRPWGLYYPPTLTKLYNAGGMADSFTYFNDSAYEGYNKPVISFTMDSSASSVNYFSIINTSDNNREFRFDGLDPFEVITVDNDRGIITSNGSSLRMEKFNKKFFRLVQGVNNLTLSGYITNLTIDAVFPKGVGT